VVAGPAIALGGLLGDVGTNAVDLGVQVIQIVQDGGFHGLGTFGRAIVVLAVVGEQQVFQQHGQLPRETGHGGDPFGQHLHADTDMTDQPTFIGVLKGPFIGQLGHLAQIVQQRPHHQQVTIQVRVERHHGVHQPHHRQGVFQEPPR